MTRVSFEIGADGWKNTDWVTCFIPRAHGCFHNKVEEIENAQCDPLGSCPSIYRWEYVIEHLLYKV
ncbi:predicted protein [Plenodomus lingam JN3]|uniref:Predicted protein n=1 Tax=Leptosphaeria maculans (strain JN3 / isolate v23.1.3 / race Av1-4-5-6-7-8) TaxID=985895 RepID=E5AAC1_LEPMJ|nr:predicted protein [Plenodomus lingam JN3]CBY00612.1 predicted protein [Plenodomus lingam JN3]